MASSAECGDVGLIRFTAIGNGIKKGYEKMKLQFRYDTTGNWYKGNTHIHSNASDGGMSLDKITTLYAGAGYKFLFQTDHWVSSDNSARSTQDAPLLWLDGIELDGTDETGSPFHVVCLGKVPPMDRKMGLVPAMAEARKHGAMLILAHPFWCGNSAADAIRHNFDGVEVYNHVCHWINAKGEGTIHWEAMLHHYAGTRVFASDDAHLCEAHPGWNGGWIVVNSPRLASEDILHSIKKGNYYASMGPDFVNIENASSKVKISTSPIVRAWLVGPRWLGKRFAKNAEELFTEAEFDVPSEWPFVHIEIEDVRGKRAWTNTLFINHSV